jgi:altronate dehydratase
MSRVTPLAAIARLPAAGDNTAIAVRTLRPGLRVAGPLGEFTLSHGVLEGHRFAIEPIAQDGPLLSWGLPFGYALRALVPGDYLCNDGLLAALRSRPLPHALPESGNFRNFSQPYVLDESKFVPGKALPRASGPRTFQGYGRGPKRGVGTRNYLVIMASSVAANPFVRALAAQLQAQVPAGGGLDGVVPVAHTEGSRHGAHNEPLVLRTLAGMMVHPNVGAVLLVGQADRGLQPTDVLAFAERARYPLAAVRHDHFILTGEHDSELARAAEQVTPWLAELAAESRTTHSASYLRVALQCGGSDAFSGVSGNPLAGAVARELIAQGGSANHAETNELVGAESYMLASCRNLGVARKFLGFIARYRELAGRHGHTLEANPSGGNFYRGLYNIAIKSIGAANKKDPALRLDYAIDYAEPMTGPGFYFMNSPGNDLESIAGQVASGVNLIFFITGNGSVTNFPFVPTLKFVTTTGRYQLLSHDMDVNAGAYLDGTPFDELTAQTTELALRVASGERSVGERAGHSQVQIWRDWFQGDDGAYATGLGHDDQVAGRAPLAVRPLPPPPGEFTALAHPAGHALERQGLILPTSLCSGQVARLITDRLNRDALGQQHGVTRFVTLPHTEGCGVSAGRSEDLLKRVLLGHLLHPTVSQALLLEHGCEKTHNDYLREALVHAGRDPETFGWASIQLDGGIAQVGHKVARWFEQSLAAAAPPVPVTRPLASLRLGLAAWGPLPAAWPVALATLTRQFASNGGLVVIPTNAPFIGPRWLAGVLGDDFELQGTLSFAAPASGSGLHFMACDTEQPGEILTGLAATGVDLILVVLAGGPVPAHPLVPVLQVSSDHATTLRYAADLDWCGPQGTSEDELVTAMHELLARAASQHYRPRRDRLGLTEFQVPRGRTGFSM